MHVIISLRARQDLGAIWDFLALRSVSVADRVTNELIDRALEIARNPYAFPVIPGGDESATRRVNVRSWAIFYEIQADHIDVIRIVQGRSDPATWS
ncbi:MAG: type II toxin-antitoxin system RelE/ParE family toxin [bacterium]